MANQNYQQTEMDLRTNPISSRTWTAGWPA